MISLKAINPSFSPINIKCNIHCRKLHNRGSSILCLSKSNESDSQASQPGDTRKQELLAQIAMIQTRKVRLTDYLDERAAYLTKIGEEANAEFDKIGEDALQGLDEAGARIKANMESQMIEFEELAELNRQEIQERENELEEFEVEMEDSRNEGLFFKSLRKKKKAPFDKAKAKEEAEKILNVMREKAGSRTRKYIYLFFMGLLIFVIVESIASSSDWRKVAVFGVILVALISQYIYEQNMLSETGTTRKTKNDEEIK